MRQLKINQQITNRDTLSLDKYLNEIGKESLLSPEDETDLAVRIQKGDGEALEILTKANLRFVVSVAKQFQGQGLTLNDLINEGNVGLIKAARKFDPSKGFRFISYAVWWIRQSIMQAIVDQARLVRLPMNKVTSYHKLIQASVKFEQENLRAPSPDELENLTSIRSSVIMDLINSSAKHVSFDAPILEDEEGSLADILQTPDEVLPDEHLVKDSLRKEINDILNTLPSREAKIINCYFGMNGEDRHTLEEIGERFGLTRERVRQIKERSLRRLRKATGTKALKSYWI